METHNLYLWGFSVVDFENKFQRIRQCPFVLRQLYILSSLIHYSTWCSHRWPSKRTGLSHIVELRSWEFSGRITSAMFSIWRRRMRFSLCQKNLQVNFQSRCMSPVLCLVDLFGLGEECSERLKALAPFTKSRRNLIRHLYYDWAIRHQNGDFENVPGTWGICVLVQMENSLKKRWRHDHHVIIVKQTSTK